MAWVDLEKDIATIFRYYERCFAPSFDAKAEATYKALYRDKKRQQMSERYWMGKIEKTSIRQKGWYRNRKASDPVWYAEYRKKKRDYMTKRRISDPKWYAERLRKERERRRKKSYTPPTIESLKRSDANN